MSETLGADGRLGRLDKSFLRWSKRAFSNPLPTIRHSTAAAPSAPLSLEIDKEALVANWKALDAMSGNVATSAVVKAEAYGIGAKRVVPSLRDAGCRNFFTSYLSEASEILRSPSINPSEVAFLHGPLTREEAAWAQSLGVRPVINSVSQATVWSDVGGGVCDLMVDTGINRLGVSMEDLSNDAIRDLKVDVVHSHLASADEDSNFNTVQLSRWQEARALIKHKRGALANSAGIALGPDFHGDLTRPGIALYGGVPCSALKGEIRQVVIPRVLVMQIRELDAGETIGYNQTFVADRPMRVGVVGLGYADGYLRCWSGKDGVMRHRGHPLPILGRVSMDMTVVGLDQATYIREGDWVEVDYDLPAASKVSGLSQYELLTLLADRFQR